MPEGLFLQDVGEEVWCCGLRTRDACLGGLWWLMDFGREPLHAGPHVDDVGVEKPAHDRGEETRHVKGEVGSGPRLMVLGEEVQMAIVDKHVPKDVRGRVK